MTVEYSEDVINNTNFGINQDSLKLNIKSDKIIKYILFICASIAFISIFFIIYFLFSKGSNFFTKIEISDFIFDTNYLPSHDLYGAGAVIIGTILVTFLAMVIPLE